MGLLVGRRERARRDRKCGMRGAREGGAGQLLFLPHCTDTLKKACQQTHTHRGGKAKKAQVTKRGSWTLGQLFLGHREGA